jgi:NOL1/NOP2/fmu family ribosome biogenesis protein
MCYTCNWKKGQSKSVDHVLKNEIPRQNTGI